MPSSGLEAWRYSKRRSAMHMYVIYIYDFPLPTDIMLVIKYGNFCFMHPDYDIAYFP
jgi:hypothetical protein